MKCPECGSKRTISYGKRKLKTGSKQIFYCNNCGKKFIERGLKGKSYPAHIVVEALKLYYSGSTLSKTSKQINSRFGIKTSRSTVYNWVSEFRNLCGYSKLRKKYKHKYGDNLIQEKKFEHSDLEYWFKFHIPKLGEVGSRFPKLMKFIQNLKEECPNELFDKAERASQLGLKIKSKLYQTKNKACKLAEFVLKANRDRNKRHKEIQDFMLKCDNATLATEIPIWYYDKKKEKSITGHIDLLQERAGKIFILDYKPQAEEVRPISQLYAYARGLSFRTGIPFKKFKAAWFNENIYKEFDPHKTRISD